MERRFEAARSALALEMVAWAQQFLDGRMTDNGNRAVVRHFTGYAKARAELAQHEAKGHEQSYWPEVAAIQSRV
jgi:hypothetical protein